MFRVKIARRLVMRLVTGVFLLAGGLCLSSAQEIFGLSCSPKSVAGGGRATGSVTLKANAGADGVIVKLSSSSSAASIPASVVVPKGLKTAFFTVSTHTVFANVTAAIKATTRTSSAETDLTVTSSAFSLSLDPTTTRGGSYSTGTATLATAAPPGGTQVALSSNSMAATVPGSITVFGGSTTAAFSVLTGLVSEPASAKNTAKLSSVSQSATLAITPIVPASVTLPSDAVPGAATAAASVTLSGAAPSDTEVALSSSSFAAMVPATITVPAGQLFASFDITSAAVPVQATATITASLNGASLSGSLTIVNGGGLSSVTFAPSQVVGGLSTRGTVRLNEPATSPGVVVTLTSSDQLTFPASVTIPTGSASASFSVGTTPLAPGLNLGVAMITASACGTWQSGSITIEPSFALSISPGIVVGGQTTTGTLSLESPAPAGGVVFNISTYGQGATFPPTVTMPAGSSTVSFPISTSPLAYGALQMAMNATAPGGNYTQAYFEILAAPALGLSFPTPLSVVGGDTASVFVSITPPAPAGGVVVALRSSDSIVASVPATVTILQGQSGATVTVRTSRVTAGASVQLGSELGGTSSSSWLMVSPPLPGILLTVLSPSGSVDAVSQNVQAGFVGSHAAVWHGTGGRFVDLNPWGWSASEVLGISGGTEVGDVWNGYVFDAAIWNGTAASFVNVGIPGAFGSYAAGVSGATVAGGYTFAGENGTVTHAATWQAGGANLV